MTKDKAHARTWASADVVVSRVNGAQPLKAQQMVTGQAQPGKAIRHVGAVKIRKGSYSATCGLSKP